MNWRYKIKGVPTILAKYDEELEMDLVPVAGAAMANLLVGSGLFGSSTLPQRFADARTEAQFNRALSAFYDDCDARAIWVYPDEDDDFDGAYERHVARQAARAGQE